ncbi:MAG: phytoene/squalene synthase family protein [Hyphomicrobium sp.]
MLQKSPERKAIELGDRQACRALLANGSRSFYAASFLLPASVRDPAGALYAFCRIADDIVDEASASPTAIPDLYERIASAYAGTPRDAPYDRAFADVVTAFAIPRALPEALIEGFSWDLQRRRYETIDDLFAYATRVAGTVGAMMCLLMHNRHPETLARATELGMAMQLTNIARDVGEDARAGRIYLPLAWCREEGVDPDRWLADPVFTPAIGRVIARVLECAKALYLRADVGIADLPAGCRPGIRAARNLYAEIGHEVERRGLDSVSTRAVVAKRRKLALLARAAVPFGPSASARGFEMVPAARFLVDAVALSSFDPALCHAAAGPAWRWWDFRGQALHVIDLFERLERREKQSMQRNDPAFVSYSNAAPGA